MSTNTDYVTCPKCKSKLCEQVEWDDLGFGPQGEINRGEKWHCCDCETDFFIFARYHLDQYSLAKNLPGTIGDSQVLPKIIHVTGY